jgi:hypothetical protein
MSEESRTILVPIDLHGINRGTLETLVRIAQRMNSSLLGLLLEDTRLQRVADLPFTTEITLGGAQERNLMPDQLVRRHSQVGGATRRLMHELAERDRVKVSFQEAAGNRWHTALEWEGRIDIFFPSRQQWVPPGTGRSMAAVKRLGILLSESDLDSKLVNIAALLMGGGLVGDTYILCARAPLPEQLHDLYRPGHQVRIQSNVKVTPSAVTRLIQNSPYDLLLLSRDSLKGIPPGLLDASIDKSGSQVLVVN